MLDTVESFPLGIDVGTLSAWIPCVEGDDELIADKLNAITDIKIDFEDAI